MSSKRVVGFHYGGSEGLLGTYRYDLISTLAFFSYAVDPTTALPSTLNGWDTTKAITKAHANGSRVVLVASNFTASGNAAVLSEKSKRATLASSLIQQVQSRGADGLLIDFEDVPADQRGHLSDFLADLEGRLRSINPNGEFGIALPASPTAAFDLSVIGQVCDYAVAMTYNYSWARSNVAGSVAPLPLVIASLQNYLDDGFPAGRLLMGVPYYGYDWQTTNTTLHSPVVVGGDGKPTDGKAKSVPQNKAAAARYGRNFDESTSTPWYSYIDTNSNPHVAWYDDQISLALKYAAAREMDLGGIGIWNLAQGQNCPELWDAIANAFDVLD